MTIPNVFDLLQSDTRKDDTAGIRIATVLDDPTLAYYATEIAPGHAVNPHYHQEGDEIYIILKGQGEMLTAPIDDSAPARLLPIAEGTVFKIEAGTVHYLRNTGSQPLTLLFACSPTHLDSDRFTTYPATRAGAAA